MNNIEYTEELNKTNSLNGSYTAVTRKQKKIPTKIVSEYLLAAFEKITSYQNQKSATKQGGK